MQLTNDFVVCTITLAQLGDLNTTIQTPLNNKRVASLVRVIQSGGYVAPMLVGSIQDSQSDDVYLLSGRHRRAAYLTIGKPSDTVDVLTATEALQLSTVVGENKSRSMSAWEVALNALTPYMDVGSDAEYLLSLTPKREYLPLCAAMFMEQHKEALNPYYETSPLALFKIIKGFIKQSGRLPYLPTLLYVLNSTPNISWRVPLVVSYLLEATAKHDTHNTQPTE